MGGRAMLSKSICFMLAGVLVVVPLWILMSYGITADGRPSSPKILVGMTFCFVVGVFWRRSEGLAADSLSALCARIASGRSVGGPSGERSGTALTS
jgi:hypothetical protein